MPILDLEYICEDCEFHSTNIYKAIPHIDFSHHTIKMRLVQEKTP